MNWPKYADNADYADYADYAYNVDYVVNCPVGGGYVITTFDLLF